MGSSVVAEFADVVVVARQKRAPLVKIEEALTVQAIVDALYRSAELKREVVVELAAM